MEPEQKPSNDKLIISPQQQQPSERLGWIIEQLTILAEAMGESLTPARLRIYATDLNDLNQARLNVAFTRARMELKFFPKIAELRELAAFGAEDRKSVEAEAAWEFVNRYLQKWGMDLIPIYAGETVTTAPRMPERIDYALRRIGGLRGLNQITEERRPFMFRDFCEAYNLAPAAEAMLPELTPRYQLTGIVQQLTPRARDEFLAAKPKSFPGIADYNKRRQELAEQAEKIRQRRPACSTSESES